MIHSVAYIAFSHDNLFQILCSCYSTNESLTSILHESKQLVQKLLSLRVIVDLVQLKQTNITLSTLLSNSEPNRVLLMDRRLRETDRTIYLSAYRLYCETASARTFVIRRQRTHSPTSIR